jgi:hypothetical protein
MNQKLFFSLLLVASTALFSCKSKPTTSDKPIQDSIALSDEPYYPISQYIEGQIAYVDSTPLAIEKHTYVNNKQVDSIIIDRPTFKSLATDFIQPDMNDPKIKPHYKETKFNDLTINTLTFSYNATDPNQELQQRDILLDPETQKVKTVLFRKIKQQGDTTITINGLWKHNMNFQLSYIIEPKNGPMQTKQVKVIWDKPFITEE